MKRGWRSWFGLGDDGIDDEIRAHLQMAVEERVARGENRRDAEFAARREFGNVTHVTQLTREMRRGAWLAVDDFVHMLTHAARRLLRSPGYCVPVIISLALGIGLNAAVFAVLDHAVRRPLPFPDDADLVAIGRMTRDSAATESTLSWFSFGNDMPAWQSKARTVEAMAAFMTTEAVVVGDGAAENAPGASASDDFLRVLRVQPSRGRWFLPGDGVATVVVVSQALALRQFGAEERAVGAVLRVSGEPRTIIGVMPRDKTLPFEAEFWLPARGAIFGSLVIARPRPDVSITQMTAELQSLSPVVANLQRRGTVVTIVVKSLREQMFGSARMPLRLLFGASVFLLVIACANVANLALTRTLERRRELAVRVALGASRRSLAGLVIVENVLLALAGAALGVMVAWWGTRVVAVFGPEEIVKVPGLGLGVSTVLFAAVVAAAAALVVSIAPVMAVNERNVHPVLGQAGAPVSRGATAPGMRRVLVAVQIATALLLITGSGLLFRSVGRLTRPAHLGFTPQGVVIASLPLYGPDYRVAGRAEALTRELILRARALPGVQSVAVGPPPLVAGRGDGVREGFNMIFSIRDPANPDAGAITAWTKHVDESYLDAYGIRLRAGRAFGASDNSATTRVAIINAYAAKVLFRDRDPINQPLELRQFTRGGAPAPVVVGVVDDILQRDLALEAYPEILLAAAQESPAPANPTIAIRSTAPPEAIVGGVRQILKALDPSLAATRLQSMQSVVDASLRRHAFIVSLLSAFAALGLTLSVIGLYAVVSYLVTQRTLEIGVRMALGAQRSDVLMLVLREGAMLIGTGIAVGVPASLGFSRLLTSFLFEVKPTDATTLVAATLSLALVALVGAWVPARRASGIDPATTLRAG